MSIKSISFKHVCADILRVVLIFILGMIALAVPILIIEYTLNPNFMEVGYSLPPKYEYVIAIASFLLFCLGFYKVAQSGSDNVHARVGCVAAFFLLVGWIDILLSEPDWLLFIQNSSMIVIAAVAALKFKVCNIGDKAH